MLHVLPKAWPVKNIHTMSMTKAIFLTLLVATTAAVPFNHQQQQQQHYALHQSPLQQQLPQHPYNNYKQQLQYQMQQHDKFEYQQHMKQQQQYYQQKYQQQHSGQQEQFHEHEHQQMDQQQTQQHKQHQQQQQQLLQHQQHQSSLQQLPPTSMALLQQQHQQQQQEAFLPVRPTQMLQTAATLLKEAEEEPQADALRGQPEYSSSGESGLKRRPVNRKRKRRPHIPTEDLADDDSESALNPVPHWRNRHDENVKNNNNEFITSTPTAAAPEPLQEMRHISQTNVRRRKPPAVREPFAPLEKEQKLYELRHNKPEKTTAVPAPTAATVNKNSENLKSILKNNGGLSLSEILQQKNLSLDDLLKGKQNALQALQTTATAPAQKLPSFRYTTKPKFKINQSDKASGENSNEAEVKERPKLTALQKLKLFGASSRPTGTQVGLVDHLTTRKKEYSTTTSTTTTTAAPSTTRIPLYKKILHQRPTLRPSVLLKNTHMMPSVQPTEQPNMSWEEKKDNHEDEKQQVVHEEEEQEEEIDQDQVIEEEEVEEEEDPEAEEIEQVEEEISTRKPDTTTFKLGPITTTYSTVITTTPSTTTSTTTTTQEPTTTKELTTSTRRMFISTRGLGRSTHRFTSSTHTPSTTSTTTTTTTTAAYSTTTQPPQTTTTTTATTTASSSTMNLTPKANLNLNTNDIRERIQETLLKNLIVKEDNFRKPTSSADEIDNDDDLENFFEESVKPKTTKSIETSTITTRMKQFSSSLLPKPTQNTNVIPDFDNVDDRTDLLELIEDRRSGNRLFKVLEQRNMTLEELIEHRKRGSSQLHLATIVQTPSRFYPDKKVLLQDNMDIVTAFENFPHFNLLNLKSVKPDEIKTDSQGSSYFTSIIDIEPTDEVYTKGKIAAGSSTLLDDKVAFSPDRSDKSLAFFPSWKTLALASLSNSGSGKKDAITSEKLTRPFFLPQPKMLLESPSDEDDYEIKENELVLINHEPQLDDEDENDNDEDEDNEDNPQTPIQAAVRVANQNNDMTLDSLGSRAHDLVDLELSGHGFKRSPVAAGALAGHKYNSFYANMPAGIRSAIVASATIVLTALVTFMVIFAVCRWKQQRHRMTNIIKSYNAMKSKMPTIATTSTAANSNIIGGVAIDSSSHHSSLREMSSLMGGSGLSVNATITTTTTGVPNTPSPAASQTTIAVATSSLPSSGICGLQRHSSVGCNNNMLQQHQQHLQLQQLQHQHQHQQHHHQPHQQAPNLQPHHLQRHNSLLMQRLPIANNNSNTENATNLSILSNCNLADLKRTNDLRGSTTSLSFSLTSGQNNNSLSPTCNKSSNPLLTPTTHSMNTMDANSPEVQEYLFDTLRNSF